MCIYIYTLYIYYTYIYIYIISVLFFVHISFDAEDFGWQAIPSHFPISFSQATMRLLQEHFAATVAQCLCRWVTRPWKAEVFCEPQYFPEILVTNPEKHTLARLGGHDILKPGTVRLCDLSSFQSNMAMA